MKKLFLSIFFITLLSGCDAPQRGRLPMKTDTLKDAVDAGTSNAISYNPGSLGSNTSTTKAETSTGTADTNFPSCDLSSKYHTIDIGYFGLCQSTLNETLFKVKFSMATTSTRNCLIPLYKDANGSSTYIGQPQCTMVNESDAIIQGSLYKNRSGLESHPLNGIIVMKEQLLPEYFACMHAYINWLPQACPNGAYSSQYCTYWMPRCPYGAKSNYACDQAAKGYMADMCNGFKSKYSNSYIDIRTK